MYDLIVIGGGPAGTAAAITAARHDARVLLLERGRYPRHKVCGEFVSPEALGLLRNLLGDDTLLRDAPRIGHARLFLDGRVFAAAISPPAASLSRFALDDALWRAADASGVECRQQTTAEAVAFADGGFTIMSSSATLTARAVIDCSGRWSNLSRNGATRNAWLGLKAHFECSQEQNTTDLYFFRGGYCGVQPVGPGRLNICAMVRADIAKTLAQVFSLDPRLVEASQGWLATMETVATSPLIFRRPMPDRDGMLCAGDAAGFIDPFAGDGIALALRTGAKAAEVLCESKWEVAEATRRYRRAYARQFAPAFRNAARFRRLLALPPMLRAPFLPMLKIAGVGRFLVRSTRAA